jgi:hypothetical protein
LTAVNLQLEKLSNHWLQVLDGIDLRREFQCSVLRPCDGAGTGCKGGPRTRWAILDGKTLMQLHSQQRCRALIRLRMGFSVPHVVHGDGNEARLL